MPTILRFRGFNIIIFVDDHEPAHVHILGKGTQSTYWLNPPGGPVTAREIDRKLSPNDRRALEGFLNDNLTVLCERWREIDDQR